MYGGWKFPSILWRPSCHTGPTGRISRFCHLRQACHRPIETFSNDDFARAPQVLVEAGIALRANGFFDFDKDGETERWVVFKHRPEENLEFWILAQTESGTQALFVRILESEPGLISYLGPEEQSPVVQIAPGILVRMQRRGVKGEAQVQMVTPDLVFSVEITKQQLDLIVSSLLTFCDPTQARDQ